MFGLLVSGTVVAVPGPGVGGRRVPATAGWTVNVELIERARILRGWTLVEPSRAARVDPCTLGDLMVGRRHPTLGTVQAIAAALWLGNG